MIPALIIIIVALIMVIIVLAMRAMRYKKAYLFYISAIDRICKASSTYDESLAIISSVCHLSEDEIKRRLS